MFGVIKRGDKVYTKVVCSCSREELLPIIKGQVLKRSDIYTDGRKTNDGLYLRVANVVSNTWGSMTGIVRVYCHPKFEEKLAGLGDQIDNIVISAASQIKWGVVS